MMMAANLRHLFETIFNPFFISVILLSISIVWLWMCGDGRLVRSCLLLSLTGFLLFGTGWLPVTLTRVLENQYPIVMKVNPKIHWVVVLGGGHDPERAGVPANDLLSSASIERLVEGVRLYRQLPQVKLLLSGGAMLPMETASEASYLASVASWFGIPPSDIVLEADSYNTADEAVAIKKIVHNASFYLVTSAIHMPRSMALCRRQRLHPIAAPTGHMSLQADDIHWEDHYLPSPRNLVRTSAAWHEILGLIWGKMRGLL